jgi:hypothetical protein
MSDSPVGSNSNLSVLAWLEDDVGFHSVHGPAHVVVDIAELAVLDEQGVPADRRALAQQHPLGPARGDLDVRGDATLVGPYCSLSFP